MGNIRIIDTTLRDGSHAVGHSFTKSQVQEVVSRLVAAGVDTIEISHGDGLGGSSYQYGTSYVDEFELITVASQVIQEIHDGTLQNSTTRKPTKLAALILPGIGTKNELIRAKELGVQVIRVATHCTEADVAEQHISYAKELGLEAIGFLMMSHMETPETILYQARLMESYGADMVYCADSAGAMLPTDVSNLVQTLVAGLSIPVGFHAHNNLGLAIGNTLRAIEAGATSVDATSRGLGASSGNAQHEVLVAVLDKMGYADTADLYALEDLAEEVIAPLITKEMVIDKYALTIGYAGVYGSFFLHAKRAAEQYGVDARDILSELGRRKTVGGQEDMILDVARVLAQGGTV